MKEKWKNVFQVLVYHEILSIVSAQTIQLTLVVCLITSQRLLKCFLPFLKCWGWCWIICHHVCSFWSKVVPGWLMSVALVCAERLSSHSLWGNSFSFIRFVKSKAAFFPYVHLMVPPLFKCSPISSCSEISYFCLLSLSSLSVLALIKIPRTFRRLKAGSGRGNPADCRPSPRLVTVQAKGCQHVTHCHAV